MIIARIPRVLLPRATLNVDRSESIRNHLNLLPHFSWVYVRNEHYCHFRKIEHVRERKPVYSVIYNIENKV